MNNVYFGVFVYTKFRRNLLSHMVYIYLSIFMSTYLFIYPSIHPSIYLSIYFCLSYFMFLLSSCMIHNVITEAETIEKMFRLEGTIRKQKNLYVEGTMEGTSMNVQNS
jgi:hypothetical protein